MALLGRFVLNTGSDEKQGLRGAMWNSSAGLPWIGGTPEHGTPQMHEEAKPKDNRTSMHSETAQWASAAPQPGAGTTAALYPPDNATNTSFELHGEEDMLPTSAAESPTDSTSSSTWKTSFGVDGRFSSTSTGSTTTSKQLASMFVSPVPFHNSSTTRTSSASSFSSTFSSTASNIMPETRTAIGTTTYTTVGSTVTSSLTTFHGTTSSATTSPATTHTSGFQSTPISETSQTTSTLLTTAGSSSSTPTTSMTTITDTSTRTSPAADTFTATYSTTSSAAATTSTTTTSSTTNRTTRTDIVTPRYTTRTTTTLSGTTSSNAILGTAPAENTHSTSTVRNIRSTSMAHISVTDTSILTYTRSTVATTSLGLGTASTARATATTTLSTACTFSTTVTATVASKSTSASGTSTATSDTAFKFQLEGPSPAVPNCYLEPLVPKSGCLRAAVLVGAQFGLNKYGQETTGKRICLNRLREAGLNTFVFRAGVCELWNCSTREALRKCADGLPLRRGTFLASQHRLVTTGRDGELVLEEDAVAGLALAVFGNEDGTVSLQSRQGRYVKARPDGTVTASSTVLGTSEKFHKMPLGGSDFALRTAHSTWLTDGLGRLRAGPAATRGHFQLHIREGSSATSAAGSSKGHPLAHRTSVHSTLCRYQEPDGGLGGRQRRSPSYVKLWEWNYVDVARECQETLGPQGFDAVQLSPFTEHVKGHQWWVRYQPVSFGLNSRSGTAPELRRAVAACRAAGVAIIADVVLNHMARPCHSAEARTNGATPCVGWSGTRYGNRQSEGAYGWDSAGPTDFHHQDSCADH